MLLQQTAKYLVDMLKNKFMGKKITAASCWWISAESPDEEQPIVKTKEDYLNRATLLKVFEHRANLLLHKSMMTLAGKLGDMKPLAAWNDTQAYLLNDLSKAFGELIIVWKFG